MSNILLLSSYLNNFLGSLPIFALPNSPFNCEVTASPRVNLKIVFGFVLESYMDEYIVCGLVCPRMEEQMPWDILATVSDSIFGN